jgi:hypothetical protein
MGDNEPIEYEIQASLGQMSLTVKGEDEEVVSELWDEKYEKLMDEASESYSRMLDERGYE